MSSRVGPISAAAAAQVDGKGVLERKLLAATASLVGLREEAAGLRREVSSLQALVARLRDDEVGAGGGVPCLAGPTTAVCLFFQGVVVWYACACWRLRSKRGKVRSSDC